MSQCEWIGVIISMPFFFGMTLITCLLLLKEKGIVKGVKIVFEVMRWGGMLFVVSGLPLQLFGESAGRFYFDITGLSKIGTSLWSTGLLFSIVLILFKNYPSQQG